MPDYPTDTAEPTREQKCADLARAMGATNFREITIYPLSGARTIQICDAPPGEKPNLWIAEDLRNGVQGGMFYQPLDYYTSHAASHALLLWLAEDDARWERFDTALLELLIDRDLWPGVGARENPHLSLGEQYRRAFMLADPALIADAAVVAVEAE